MLHKIKMLKFITAEFAICEVVEEKDDCILVKNAVGLQVSQQGIAFVPWPMFVAENAVIEVPRSSLLVSPLDVVDELKNEYNSKICGGITMPTKGGLIL